MIYFAQLPTGAIKIGTTEDIEARLVGLKAHYGVEPALLATMPGDRSVETEIHERFAHLRFGKTEQFRPGPDLMEFIGKPLLVAANPESVEIQPYRRRDVLYIELDPETRADLDALADDEAARTGQSRLRVIGPLIRRLLREERIRRKIVNVGRRTFD